MSSYPKPNLCIFLVTSCFAGAENDLNMYFKCIRQRVDSVDSLCLAGWPFGSVVCKLSGMVQGISVSASVFTLVAIAVDR